MTVILPGTISAAELARALGRGLDEVCAVLRAHHEPDGPDDFVAGELALEVAEALGVDARIEPRDLALSHLYALETMGDPSLPEGRARAIVEGVLADLDAIDERIESVSQHWTVSRMPVIDRNVLRIALYEMEREPTIPIAVIISEAVRLAGAYSTERSASFVNGVLSSLARTIRG